MPFDPPPPAEPTLADILASPFMAEFLADAARTGDPDAAAGEWLAYIDDDYAEQGVHLPNALLTDARRAMVAQAECAVQDEADRIYDGWVAGDLTRDGRVVPMPRYAAV